MTKIFLYTPDGTVIQYDNATDIVESIDHISLVFRSRSGETVTTSLPYLIITQG